MHFPVHGEEGSIRRERGTTKADVTYSLFFSVLLSLSSSLSYLRLSSVLQYIASWSAPIAITICSINQASLLAPLLVTQSSSKRCAASLQPASSPLLSACPLLACSKSTLRVCLYPSPRGTTLLTSDLPVSGQHVYNDGDGSREQSHVEYQIDNYATCGVLIDNHTRLQLQQSTISRIQFDGENNLTAGGLIGNAVVCAVCHFSLSSSCVLVNRCTRCMQVMWQSC